MVAVPGPVLFVLTVATFAAIFGLLGLGLNVHFGYTGLLNFGHVAFFAAGAYVAAILTIPPPGSSTTAEYALGLALPMPLGFGVSVVAAAAAGGLLALLIGLSSIRLKTHYLAVATFALAQLFHSILVNERWLTRGSDGLNDVPKPGYGTVFATDVWQVVYFGVVVAFLIAVYLALDRLVESPFGRVLKGVREDETAARVLGKGTTGLKLRSFVVGGAIAGLAGALYAHYVGSVAPSQFLPLVTFLVWVMMIIGGVGSNRGVILGAALVIAFRDFTQFLPSIPGHPLLLKEFRWAVIGLVLLLIVRWRPQGLLGEPGEIVLAEEGE